MIESYVSDLYIHKKFLKTCYSLLLQKPLKWVYLNMYKDSPFTKVREIKDAKSFSKTSPYICTTKYLKSYLWLFPSFFPPQATSKTDFWSIQPGLWTLPSSVCNILLLIQQMTKIGIFQYKHKSSGFLPEQYPRICIGFCYHSLRDSNIAWFF